MKYSSLDASKIEQTAQLLVLRIHERFPDCSLACVGRRLCEIARETRQTADWIRRPDYRLRALVFGIIAALVTALLISIFQMDLKADGLGLADIVTVTEAALNEVVLIGAGIVFLTTLETRRKRKRVINAINRLRCLAHIIDAHQLTKDPHRENPVHTLTAHSPRNEMSDYELGRYLDYCSEMLSLTSKVAFLYVQEFDDPVANESMNDLESMTTGLSRKIWQKIMILNSKSGEPVTARSD